MSTVTIFSKSIFASKMFWFNAVAILVAALNEIANLDLPIVREQWFITVLAVGNILLRLVTKQPATLQKGSPVEVKKHPDSAET